MTPYPKEVIQNAKKLFLEGIPVPKIAKILKIKRKETIFAWRKKFDWGSPISRTKDLAEASLDSAQQQRCVEVWTEVLNNSVKRLKATEFKSAEGIVEALKSATDALLKLSALKSIHTESSEDNPSSTLKDIFNL